MCVDLLGTVGNKRLVRFVLAMCLHLLATPVSVDLYDLFRICTGMRQTHIYDSFRKLIRSSVTCLFELSHLSQVLPPATPSEQQDPRQDFSQSCKDVRRDSKGYQRFEGVSTVLETGLRVSNGFT